MTQPADTDDDDLSRFKALRAVTSAVRAAVSRLPTQFGMPQSAEDIAKKTLLSRRATLTRVQASNDSGILALSTEKQAEDLAENTDISGALVLLSDRERVELAEINAALARIENRTWGRCETCGAQIDSQRLVAMPEARTCFTHAL